MKRWDLMLQKLFGSRREQPETCRPKETTKLRLEVLEDRTMPSGSPLPVQ